MAQTKQFLTNLKKFRLVTFDVTGTILNFKVPPEVLYANTAASLGYPGVNEKLLSSCFRNEFKTMSKCYPNYGYDTDVSWQEWWLKLVANIFHCADPKIPSKDIAIIAKKLFDQYRGDEGWSIADGAAELVHNLKKANKIVGVISNFDPSLPELLKTMTLSDFDFVLTSYECGVLKPEKQIFEIPLQKYNLNANEALHIGNIIDIDYVGARNAGWSSIVVLPGKCDNIPKEVPPNHVFRSLTDILSTLNTTHVEF